MQDDLVLSHIQENKALVVLFFQKMSDNFYWCRCGKISLTIIEFIDFLPEYISKLPKTSKFVTYELQLTAFSFIQKHGVKIESFKGDNYPELEGILSNEEMKNVYKFTFN